jgi:hypothetical protein
MRWFVDVSAQAFRARRRERFPMPDLRPAMQLNLADIGEKRSWPMIHPEHRNSVAFNAIGIPPGRTICGQLRPLPSIAT